MSVPVSGASRARRAPRFTLVTLLLGTVLAYGAHAAERTASVPSPAFDNPKAEGPAQTAVLAGGCFWGVQGVFQHVNGVRRVLSGYSGGSRASAEYETVSSGTTGHAESVQIVFDPKTISYGEILQIFFSVAHDPTQLNRQGPDHGTQYRSAVFYDGEAQKKIATAYIAQLQAAHVFAAPIVTRVDALQGFYPAEDYHQDYLLRNPWNPYIVYNDVPKVHALQQQFPARYVDKPVRVTAP